MRLSFHHPDTLKIQEGIAKDYAEYFVILEKVEVLAESVFSHKDIVWDSENDFSKLTLYLISRFAQRTQAIETLCRAGFAKDAIILLRTMFEDLITFKYIQKDRNRIKDLIDFDIHERLNGINIILENTLLDEKKKRKLTKKREILKIEWDKVKPRFTAKNGHVFSRWSGKSLKEMCEDPEDKKNYIYAYNYFSKYVHLSLLPDHEYILGREGNNVVVQTGPSDQLVTQVIHTLIIFLLQFLNVLNIEYTLSSDTELDSINKDLQSLK